VPKPPAGLSVAARDTLAVQSGDKAGARLRPEVCAAVMGRGFFVIARARGQTQKQSERATPIGPEAPRAVTLVRPKPRRCRWPCFAHQHWPTRVFGRPLSQRWMRPNRMFRPAVLLLADHCSRDSTGQPAPGALKAFMLLTEAPAGSFTRYPLTSTPTTTISTPAGRAFLLQSKSSAQRLPWAANIVSNISAHAIRAHVD
jgi:hypothetical protein